MDLRSFLFSFHGRINRAKYWLAMLVMLGTMLSALVLISLLFGNGQGRTSFVLGSAVEIAGRPIGDMLSWALAIPISVFLLWVCAANSVKRLHDRNKSAWWLLPFAIAPWSLGAIGDYLGDSYIAIILQSIALLLSIWYGIETLLLRGTPGRNEYGPDPLVQQAVAVHP